MGKDKVIEKITEEIPKINKSSIILQYAPLIIGLICIVACYLLYKKIQSLNSRGDTLSKIEAQFTGFVKEQSELNTINSKKFNVLMSQVNQLNYIIENLNGREVNSMDTQMSPERPIISNEPVAQGPQGPQGPTEIKQPIQREMMPTSAIQTGYPIEQQAQNLPIPTSTSLKKEINNNEISEINKVPVQQKTQKKESKSKKVVNLENLKEEVMIEEVSSDDE